MTFEFASTLLLNGIIVGALYGVVAMSFVLIYKATQVVNFAQGEFLLVGAWVCWWLLVQFQVPFFIGFFITLAFMGAFGVLLQIVVLRPLIGEPIISIIMVTIGLSLFFQALMGWIFGVVPESYPQIFETPIVELFGLRIQTIYLWSLAISLVIMAVFAWFFKYSKQGLAMRATAFDQQAAQSMGVNVKHVFAMSWAIAAVVSAVAGVVTGVINGVSPGLAAVGIQVFPAVILGGLDSIVGAVVGGLIIGVLERVAFLLDVTWLKFGNLQQIAPFYVLIAILMFKPYGLFGTRDIERI